MFWTSLMANFGGTSFEAKVINYNSFKGLIFISLIGIQQSDGLLRSFMFSMKKCTIVKIQMYKLKCIFVFQDRSFENYSCKMKFWKEPRVFHFLKPKLGMKLIFYG